MNTKRFWAIVRKEIIHIVRDKPTLAIVLVMPIMMLFLFGYAVSTDVDHVSTAVINRDPGQASRTLLEKLEQSQLFDLNYFVNSEADVRALVESGRVKAGLLIPADYSQRLARGEVAQVSLVIDGSDPLVARTVLSGGQSVAQAFSAQLMAEKAERIGLAGRLRLPIEIRSRVWYNPDLISQRFNLPGLLGVILQNITILLTAFALVRERERGTIEQLIVTPVKSPELIIGKLLPYLLIGFVEVTLTLSITVFWFGVGVSGNLWLLLACSLLFLVGALGIGLLVSTVAQNQLQAMQMAFAFLLPSIFLSGFIFPRDSMPALVSALGYGVPLTYFLTILRGIILKGIGAQYLWRETLILGLYGVAILSLAALRFRKKLD